MVLILNWKLINLLYWNLAQLQGVQAYCLNLYYHFELLHRPLGHVRLFGLLHWPLRHGH